MRRSLLNILVDPIAKTPLQVEVHTFGTEGDIVEGVLRGPEGRSYEITKGIPRFVITEDRDQKQTENSFGFKWRQRKTYDSPQFRMTFRQWFMQRYDFTSVGNMQDFFARRRRILDAGCGSGFSSSLFMEECHREKGNGEWVGVEISEAIDVAQERLGSIPGTHFIQADIMHLPFRQRLFDTIISEGVLHHTPSTELALKSLVPLLEPRGEILFYVYRKKGPIREFTDDYVRSILSPLDPEAAWAQLRSLTKLGQALAGLHAEVEIPEDVPLLGIKAGRYDVQRLIYWHFAKLFWNECWSFEENNHVNFDWYHPRYAHRHTDEEIRRWCAENKISISRFDIQESGFTVRAVKQ